MSYSAFSSLTRGCGASTFCGLDARALHFQDEGGVLDREARPAANTDELAALEAKDVNGHSSADERSDELAADGSDVASEGTPHKSRENFRVKEVSYPNQQQPVFHRHTCLSFQASTSR